MGNFKHQPLRSTADRERDTDKDRDYRDKDGHERLRNVSPLPSQLPLRDWIC
jgi:hypothetical protein